MEMAKVINKEPNPISRNWNLLPRKKFKPQHLMEREDQSVINQSMSLELNL